MARRSYPLSLFVRGGASAERGRVRNAESKAADHGVPSFPLTLVVRGGASAW